MSFRHMLAMAGGRDSQNPPVKTTTPMKKVSSSVQTQGTALKPTNSPLAARSSSAKPKTTPTSITATKSPTMQRGVTSTREVSPKATTHRVAPTIKSTAPPAKRSNSGTTSRSPSPNITSKTPTSVDAPLKKFSFRDVMKKAETVDKDKLKVQVKTKERKVEAPRQTKTAALLTAKPSTPPKAKPRPTKTSLKPAPQLNKSAPAPIARPSAKLAQKLKRKASQYDEDSDEMDDFIEDDEHEDEYRSEPSYRDEIWKMFNRGRGRQDFVDEDSDDDMEATGADILAEEMRSAKQARREDLEEEARLQKLAAEKASRKSRK